MKKNSIHLTKLGIDVVHGCQLRCIGCPNSTIKPMVQPIRSDDFVKILNNIDVGSVGLFRLFNFGEPLFNDDLGEILLAIKAWKIPVNKVEISTNGQYHNFDAIFAALLTGRLDVLAVSCDGDGTPKEYERLRPPAKWDKLIYFLETISKFCEEHSLNTSLINRVICTSVTAQQRWKDLLNPIGWKPEFRDWQLLPDSLLSKEKDFSDNFSSGSGICSFIKRDTLYVDASGDVVTCCVHPSVEVLGNLKDETFSSIYHGKRSEFAEYLKEDRSSHEICSQCQY